jgi:hypothetical protein
LAICSLIYSSRRTDPDPTGIVESILESAQRNNALLGLTGALVFDHRFFVQLLEGSRATVTDMFLRISQDPRHAEIRLMRVDETARRRFPVWYMHHAAMRGSGLISARAYMPQSDFEPSELSAEGAMALFDEVAEISRAAKANAA